MTGIDPDAMTKEEATSLAVMTANIYAAMPPWITVTQYYVHAESTRITLRDRPHSIVAHRLSKAREHALNGRGLATSRLIHMMTYRDPRGWNDGLLRFSPRTD
jgi:chromosome condensin MukBEF complex kleisin-like MukF subunit